MVNFISQSVPSQKSKFLPVLSKLVRYHSCSWDILFFGTDRFAIKSLEYLNNFKSNNSLVNKLEIVCPVERRRQKDIWKHAHISTVRQWADVNNLKIHDWPLEPENSSFIAKFHLGVVVSFGHFIPSWVLKRLQCGAINLHPSLLPRWRGPSPILHTLLNGDKETGVSVIEVSPKKRSRLFRTHPAAACEISWFDAGSILAQEKIQVSDGKTHEVLSDELSDVASHLLGKVLTNFNAYKHFSTSQDEKLVTKAPKVTKELGYIKWSQNSCTYIYRLWCAISQQIGLKCIWKNSIVKLVHLVEINTFVPGAPETAQPGQPYFYPSKNILYIKCKDGWVGWKSLQMEYRKVITAKEFYNGYLIDKNNGENITAIFQDLD